jgi:hypothetical protein
MLHRARPSPGHVLHARNAAFRIVAAAALAAIAAIALLPAPAHWFGFVPVTATWLAAAAALPLAGLALLKVFSRKSPDAVERVDAHS